MMKRDGEKGNSDYNAGVTFPESHYLAKSMTDWLNRYQDYYRNILATYLNCNFDSNLTQLAAKSTHCYRF